LQVPANRIGARTLSLGAIEDHAGGHHVERVRALRCALHAPARETSTSCGQGCVLLGAVYFMFR
jgi:uncharacterized protein (DUF486 family)